MSLPKPHPETAVLVTGASSGIGTELARGLAREGHNLVLVARRKDRLEALAEELQVKHGVRVDVQARDLGTGAERAALVTALRSGASAIVGVCNCAGFGTSGQLTELPVEREREMIDLNVTAVMELTHAFLGDMVRRGEGAILNVASLAAFQPIPGLATYAASKAFVQSFSEAVHEEVRGTGVSCTVLCPGPVQTEWAEVAGAESWMVGPAKVAPEDVARDAIAGMVHGKRSVIPGIVPKALGLAGRFTPRSLLLPGVTFGARIRGS